MAQALRFWPVNNADRALEPCLTQDVDLLIRIAQVYPKARQTSFVEQFFVASLQRRTNSFALGPCAPVRSCGHSPMISAETDEHCFARKTFPHELSDIQFAVLAYLGRTRIAQV